MSKQETRREGKRETREEDEAEASSSSKRSRPTIIEQTGTKRTSSKIATGSNDERSGEPEAKSPKEGENTNE